MQSQLFYNVLYLITFFALITYYKVVNSTIPYFVEMADLWTEHFMYIFMLITVYFHINFHFNFNLRMFVSSFPHPVEGSMLVLEFNSGMSVCASVEMLVARPTMPTALPSPSPSPSSSPSLPPSLPTGTSTAY